MASDPNVLLGGTKLGQRFLLVSQLPTAAFTLMFTLLIESGAPGSAPDPARLSRRLHSLGTQETVIVGIGVLAISVILQPKGCS